MNKPAAIISALFGAAFFTVELMYPDNPLARWSGSLEFLLSDHAKARNAISKLLIVPASAEFAVMRSVSLEKNKYVCGRVKGKTGTGSSVQREFLYNVVSDYGTVDDDGQITRPHGRYRPCPIVDESKPAPPIVIDLEKANKIIQALPKAEIKILPPLGSGGQTDMAGGGSNPALPSLSREGASDARGAGATSSASSSPFVASLDNEKDWRPDKPSKAWPKFPPDDPLSKPGTKVSVKDALASATRIEDRWQRYEASKSGTRPSVDEIEDTLRMLLTIEGGSADPQAWAAFVRLRKIQRAAMGLTGAR